jgi:tetratricopeptide (TPR) repeat protein
MALNTASEANLALTKQQQLSIYQGLGDASWMAGNPAEAQKFYGKALSYNSVVVEGNGLIFKCSYLDVLSGTSLDSLIQRADKYESRLDTTNNPLIEVHHFLYKGYGFLFQGREEDAWDCYQRSRETLSRLVSSSKDKRFAFDLAEVYRSIGEAHIWWGNYQQSADDLEKALVNYEMMGDLMGELQTRLLLGELNARTGDWNQALVDLTHVIEETTRIENLTVLPEALFRRGYVYCDRGDWELAESDAAESQKISQETSNSMCQAGAQFLLNRLMIRRGETHQAIEPCRAMEAITRYLDVGMYLCLALRYLGEAYLGSGSPDLARACCQEGLELAKKAGFKREVGVNQRVLGEALCQLGEWDLALENIQNSIQSLDRMNSPFELGESYRNLGRYQWEMDMISEAGESMLAARKIFGKLGARHDTKVTSRLISELNLPTIGS